MIQNIAGTAFQLLFILLVAPFATGIVRYFKARLQGRRGSSPLLPYISLAVLLKKQMVIPEAASWIFRAVPFVVFSSTIFLALVLPLLFTGAFLASFSDFFLIAGILAIGAIFIVLGGIDAGSAFGGMGSSREMTLAALLEPTLIMIFSTLSFVAGDFTIDGMIGGANLFLYPFLFFSVIALILVSLAENARYPVDNPATHLELTMVHEAMILEYSGPYLAMLEYASSIKLTVFALLITNIIFPFTLQPASVLGIKAIFISAIFTFVKVVVMMGLLALLESVVAKMRFYRMSEYLSIAFVSALFGMVVSVFSSSGQLSLGYHAIFSIVSVFFVLLIFGRAKQQAVLRYYALSSLAIAGIAYGLAMLSPENRTHLLIFAVATILIKTIAVPLVITYVQREYKYLVSPSSFLRPASSYFLAMAILIATFFAVNNNPAFEKIGYESLLYASVAMILLGLATMVIHRNIFSQIIGLLVIENGIAIFTLVTVESLPLPVESGVFLVTALTAIILASLSSRIRELIGSADTEELRNITE